MGNIKEALELDQEIKFLKIDNKRLRSYVIEYEQMIDDLKQENAILRGQNENL